MSKAPASLTAPPQGYAPWLAALKERIHAAQQRAALAVNRELVLLYWHIGRDILQRQTQQGWGSKVIERLAHDLKTAFPEMKGFSPRNLKYMRAFAQAWPEPEIVQQAVGQLPWGQQMIAALCPDGVETQQIGDFAELARGNTRALFMQGIGASYHNEGRNTFKTGDL